MTFSDEKFGEAVGHPLHGGLGSENPSQFAQGGDLIPTPETHPRRSYGRNGIFT